MIIVPSSEGLRSRRTWPASQWRWRHHDCQITHPKSHFRRPEFSGTMTWEPLISQDMKCWEEAVAPAFC